MVAASQFVTIGSDTAMPIQSIVPAGEDTSDNVYIQTLDAYGYTVDNYAWVNWAGDNGDQEAWIDDNFEIVEGVSFAPGTGLWVYGSTANQSIQTAGLVGKSDVSVALRPGAIGIGNPFPVAVNIQDILPTGDDTSDNVYIQTLDAYGYTVDNYAWVNWAGDNGDQEAWINDDFEIVTDVTFAPGQGLWVYGSSTEQALRFPAPEL